MKIKDLKKIIRCFNEENDVFIALETLDKNGIGVTICYEIEMEPCNNAGNLQINIKDIVDIQGTFE